MESHLQTSDTGTEPGTLSCRAIRQMTRSKIVDGQKGNEKGERHGLWLGPNPA